MREIPAPKGGGMTKRDIFTLVMIGVFIGIVLGYSWRMIQLEPILNKEISLLYRENKLVVQENELLKARLATHQVSLKKKK